LRGAEDVCLEGAAIDLAVDEGVGLLLGLRETERCEEGGEREQQNSASGGVGFMNSPVDIPQGRL
jgi:hypothetical protein